MSKHSWLAKLVQEHSRGSRPSPELPEGLGEAWRAAAQFCDMDLHRFAAQVGQYFDIPVCDFDSAQDVVGRFIPYKLAREKHIAPVRLQGDTLIVATADPADEGAIQQARFAAARSVSMEVAAPGDIDAHISKLYTTDVSEKLKNHIRLTEEGLPTSDSSLQSHSIVKLARQMLYKAVSLRASDIHVQPHVGGGQIRFRVDGVLRRSASMPSNVMERLIRYFMNMTGMDPSKAMVPQDGRGALFIGNRRIDLRVSVLPNREGNRLVIRMLDQSSVFSVASLNIPPQELKILRRLTSFSQGMILFTGPTGSGKTTSLYGLLSSLNNEKTNIITLENPVEYQLHGLSQVDIDEARGLSFAAGLRSILRQDPDILLVGEIRDEETATIATRAALTGHLLFSTLHTMDARNAISRLLDLGVSQPVLGETLLGIVAQRLVRKLCPHCAVPTEAPYSNIEDLFRRINNRPPAMRAVGCEKCDYTGYKGRAPVQEIIEMTPRTRHLLMTGSFSLDAFNENLPSTFQTLGQRARGLVQSGETTVDEAHRVLGFRFWDDIAKDENVDALELLVGDIGGEGVERANLLMVSEERSLAEGYAEHARDHYNIHCFSEIGEAQEFLRSNRNTDLLILDMEHAGKSCKEFLLDLRSAFDWSGLPAVVILPEGDDSIDEMLTSHGANFVLKKPFEFTDLDAQILSVFQR